MGFWGGVGEGLGWGVVDGFLMTCSLGFFETKLSYSTDV